MFAVLPSFLMLFVTQFGRLSEFRNYWPLLPPLGDSIDAPRIPPRLGQGRTLDAVSFPIASHSKLPHTFGGQCRIP